MTQTEANPDVFFGLWDILPNEPLVGLMHRHMTATGLDWTEEEQDVARACQAAMGVPEAGLATTVTPPFGEVRAGGSSDVGDVSWNTPRRSLPGPACRWASGCTPGP